MKFSSKIRLLCKRRKINY